jgi:deazaflavin-dependent oxidoreductase (nitroreductase family)
LDARTKVPVCVRTTRPPQKRNSDMNDEGTARGVRRIVDAGLEKVASEKLVHVTTIGRKTRNPHTAELWFAIRNGRVYLSHEGSETDWMKNIENNDKILFEIGGKNFTGRARILENGTEEAWEAKVALYEKYYGKASKEIIEDWFSLSRLITIEPS